jgi:dTDP-4-amino-4,6-dideoxygalactose transaminase
MIVTKKQKAIDRFRFDWKYYGSAREGFFQALQSENLKTKKILLPAYIGFSNREGSGVFDPVKMSECRYEFYRMTHDLNINVNDLKKRIQKNKGNILLLIHYFGFKDINIFEIKKCARKNKMVIIEDFAHSFFTFWLNPVVDFDIAFFSIHKLFPVNTGGMVLTKKMCLSGDRSKAQIDLFNYDMQGIINKRIENYQLISSKIELKERADKIVLLRKTLKNEVPQTCPVLVDSRETRDNLYFKMNEYGYGVVSLYNTLIGEIDSSFFTEHHISDRILNLPVHQDVEKENIEGLVDYLFEIIE